MNTDISLKNTAEFFKIAKERSKLFDDYEFDLQIHYFEDICSRDKVTSEQLMALLDVVDFWELWLSNVSALKKFTGMAIEIGCYVYLLAKYNATAKIKEEI